MKELLKSLKIEDIHKRVASTKMHSLRGQMVMDVQKARELAADVPFVAQLLADLAKPAVYDDVRMLHFYGGMLCMLNVIVDHEEYKWY